MLVTTQTNNAVYFRRNTTSEYVQSLEISVKVCQQHIAQQEIANFKCLKGQNPKTFYFRCLNFAVCVRAITLDESALDMDLMNLLFIYLLTALPSINPLNECKIANVTFVFVSKYIFVDLESTGIHKLFLCVNYVYTPQMGKNRNNNTLTGEMQANNIIKKKPFLKWKSLKLYNAFGKWWQILCLVEEHAAINVEINSIFAKCQFYCNEDQKFATIYSSSDFFVQDSKQLIFLIKTKLTNKQVYLTIYLRFILNKSQIKSKVNVDLKAQKNLLLILMVFTNHKFNISIPQADKCAPGDMYEKWAMVAAILQIDHFEFCVIQNMWTNNNNKNI
ncbi:hypothetical protein EGR_01845 [Echinococcus granulosus]|uniref:Uncharacterized protein n=1 Tax=Echinococcus granulosus TaxID=6210 RepID=W6V9M7_ECHGR|nr:hypothetical protein EGR_01845 [Echinococcus granulosus]EUB63354.1 hypothetical protein EGR_01845 [Echinococcus granulosus]